MLRASTLQGLQLRKREVNFIFADEMPMVGQDLLDFIDIRVQHVVEGRTPEGNDQRGSGKFGGLNLIILRYPMQLPPMGAATTWVDNLGNTGHAVKGLRTCLA